MTTKQATKKATAAPSVDDLAVAYLTAQRAEEEAKAAKEEAKAALVAMLQPGMPIETEFARITLGKESDPFWAVDNAKVKAVKNWEAKFGVQRTKAGQLYIKVKFTG